MESQQPVQPPITEDPMHQQPAGQSQLPVSVGDRMVTLLIMIIPIVNIVMLFVWAFGDSTKVSKANWAKASLIWMAIGIVFSILLFMAGVGLVSALMG